MDAFNKCAVLCVTDSCLACHCEIELFCRSSDQYSACKTSVINLYCFRESLEV